MSSTSRAAAKATAQTVKVREAVAVFENAADLEATIEELAGAGFHRADISLLASDAAVDAKLAHRYQRVERLEDDPSAPRAAYVSTPAVATGQGAAMAGLAYIGATVAAGVVVASGGTMAAVIAAAIAAGGGGGALGSIAAKWLGTRHAQTIEEQVNAGGLLLWVNIRDPEHERRALDILSHHSTRDVHVHEITREWSAEDRPLAEAQPDPFLFGSGPHKTDG